MGGEGEVSETVTVLGAGSWGMALSVHLARRGAKVVLWARDPEQAEVLARTRQNPRYLGEVVLPPNVTPTADLGHALGPADVVVCAVPSHGVRSLAASIHATAPELATREKTAFLLAAKGLEVETGLTMQAVVADELPGWSPGRLAVLGGPSFAAEVAAGLPTAVVIASTGASTRLALQRLFSGSGLRAYVTDDLMGVELGGALKNVIALAAGMCDGAGLGQNARAGLITRGLAEISRLAEAMGAHTATLSGLAGLGDLVLTCTGGLSRNRRVGLALGQGRSLEEILAELGMVAEGVRTTAAARALARAQGVEMPIVETMDAILSGRLTVLEAVEALMGRELKGERD